MKKLKTRLFKGLSEDRHEELRNSRMAARLFVEQLTQALEDDITMLHEDMLNEEHFDKPDWKLIQVNRVAQVKAFNKVLNLLK